MKKLIVLFLLSITNITLAQDKKAEAILNAMSAKYKSYKSYNAVFSYGVENSAGKVGQSFSGNVTVKGDKFLLKTAGQEIYNNGKDIYTFVKETNEVNISDLGSNSESDFSPTKIYSIYKTGYKYSYKQAVKIGSANYDVIDLSPSTAKANVSKIEMTINKADNSIKNWKVWDKAGKKTSFNISKFTPNVAVSEATFNFDKRRFPGVEVVDLR